MRVIPLEVRDTEIEALVQHGFLDRAHRNNRDEIARALGTLLDRIPVAWWQRAIELPRAQ